MTDVTDSPGATRCIAVRLGQSLYGLRVEEVQEVIAARSLTRVFHAPQAMAGVMSLRGEMLPVLDLGVMVGRPPAPRVATNEARIVVVRETGAVRRCAGLRVDELGGLRDIPEKGLAPVPSTASDSVKQLVIGVIDVDPPCAVLSVEAILSAPEIASLAGSSAGDVGA